MNEMTEYYYMTDNSGNSGSTAMEKELREVFKRNFEGRAMSRRALEHAREALEELSDRLAAEHLRWKKVDVSLDFYDVCGKRCFFRFGDVTMTGAHVREIMDDLPDGQ